MRPTEIRFNGEVVAVIGPESVVLLPPIDALERDHPRRRFVSMMALIGREMQMPPDAEPYDDAVAEFYARSALMRNEEFLEADDGRADAELAEQFNVPLDQIEAKRYDLAFLRPPRSRDRRRD